jgi:hypothetical protein
MSSELTSNEVVALLRPLSLFANVEDGVLRLFASNPMTRTVQHLAAGAWIIEQDCVMPVDVGMNVMLTGIAHVLRRVDAGVANRRPAARKLRTAMAHRHVAFRYPPDQSGALIALTQSLSEVGVRCLTDCSFIQIALADLRTALRISEIFAHNLYAVWSRRFRQYALRAEWGKYLTAHETVAAFLVEAGKALKSTPDQVPYLPMKQREIAAYVGVPADKLRLEILKEFKRLKLITTSGKDNASQRGKIYIPDPDAIVRHYSRCVPGPVMQDAAQSVSSDGFRR